MKLKQTFVLCYILCNVALSLSSKSILATSACLVLSCATLTDRDITSIYLVAGADIIIMHGSTIAVFYPSRTACNALDTSSDIYNLKCCMHTDKSFFNDCNYSKVITLDVPTLDVPFILSPKMIALYI